MVLPPQYHRLALLFLPANFLIGENVAFLFLQTALQTQKIIDYFLQVLYMVRN